ncbi:hypothetical protein BGZ99_007773 [Dissophora globulifera]|uniref:Cyanovirin-N domain-containing protein n=1 Tax=Dissophora globulifera TaxID=979702 RepID=A0A9P6UQ63_9FUNG|nr:hypothetical protein BGZ99_007773 [Dissophora globulifera]
MDGLNQYIRHLGNGSTGSAIDRTKVENFRRRMQYKGQHGSGPTDSLFLMDHKRNETLTKYQVSITYTAIWELQGILGDSDRNSAIKHWNLRFKCHFYDIEIDFGDEGNGKGCIGSNKALQNLPDYPLFEVRALPTVLQDILNDMKTSGRWDNYDVSANNCQHFAAAMIQSIFNKHQEEQENRNNPCCFKVDKSSITSKGEHLRQFDLNSKNPFAIFAWGSFPFAGKGDFTKTSKDISLDHGHILRAQCQAKDGEWEDSSIDLNDFIGNNNGMARILMSNILTMVSSLRYAVR